MRPVATLTCAGCGAAAGARALDDAFRCSRADERPDVDHVVTRTLEASRVRIDERERDNPFLRYREFLYAYQFAVAHGLRDVDFATIVRRLDDAIARVDGRGFRITPLTRSAPLEARLGLAAPAALWIKDETQNVSGSHKARHLMGVMLYLEVLDALGIARPRRRELAIASCGNAALAAAVVARAAGYALRVFVPVSADGVLVDRIRALGAAVETCARSSSTPGDPTYARFRQAVAKGALPFCCQGNENGLTIDGGETLGLEIAESLASGAGRLVVQVGGGALAASCLRAFGDMRAIAGVRMPRFHAVQTAGAHPLTRAFDAVVARLDLDHGRAAGIDAAMKYARTHRSAFMQPWETEPRSVAHGILDDETYDWAALVEGMLQTSGTPVVVSEAELADANRVARDTTRIDVDHTGSAGLAGFMQLLTVDPAARTESAVVIFSGVRR
ncbi:MAG TPA: PLP-dependent lyase/thiolase [Vicinamibacterales bacterium]|nr:PLP-dependent lyase/thiolase [Vicinamibacterales bacterium]